MVRSATTVQRIIAAGAAVGAIIFTLLLPRPVAGQFEPPAVRASLFVDRESFDRTGDPVTGTVVITNPSNLTIEATVRSVSRDFTSAPVSLQLPPYSTPEAGVSFDVRDDAEFGDRKVTVLVSYSWTGQGEAPAGSGATSASADVKLVGVFGQEESKPPTVTAQLILDRSSFERTDDPVTGTVLITNPSNLTIQANVRSVSRNFTSAPVSLQLPPNSAPQVGVGFDVRDDAEFGDQKVTVFVSYAWTAQGEVPAGSGATSSTADVKLLHHFEEGLGIVDGGAAAVYFLLPLLILFTAFVVSRSYALDGQFPPQLPKVDLKSFALLILATAVVYAVADRTGFQIYTGDLPSDPMLGKIAISMGLAGIAIPVGWWAARSGRRKVWGFSGDETEADIIRKAITGPMRRLDFETITATVRGTEYKGILLEERERRFFLGPQLEVVPKQAALTSKQDREFASKVVSESGQIIDRKRLAELVKRKKLQIGAPVKVTRGGVASATLVCMVESKLDVADHHPAPLVKAAERD